MRPSSSPFLRVALPVALLIVAFATAELARLIERSPASSYPLTANRSFRPLGLGGDLTPPQLATVAVPVPYVVRSGDSLDVLFRRFGLSSEEAYVAALAAAEHSDPRKLLRAGDTYSALFSGGRELAGFAFTIHGEGRVLLEQGSEGWQSRFEAYQRSRSRGLVAGVLDGALETSMERAGGPGPLAYAVAEVLQWDLDFNRDLRAGDRFVVLYERTWLDGQPQGLGEVLGLVYDNRGRRLEGYRFEQGYYDGEGRPLRKQFLRSPLPYSRVTSRFSQRRFHPVLKEHRPHFGVDYGAPIGTAVRVTASGIVDFVGWDGGGGRTVKVRHPNDYVSAYLHLSRFAGGLRRGLRVEQGDVIGFVGATGLATGPHLDYRIAHRGRFIDPLSLANEPASPIPPAELDRFFAHRDRLRQDLERAPAVAGEEAILAVWEREQAAAGP